jgi:hypothetical protein
VAFELSLKTSRRAGANCVPMRRFVSGEEREKGEAVLLAAL